MRKARPGHGAQAVALPLLALGLLGCSLAPAEPRAIAGELDLSHWDFAAGGTVDLQGEWAVCWGRLLEPGIGCPEGWKTVPVRGLWTDREAGGPFGGRGVATYRLRIALPPGERALSLRAGAPMTSYRLWIDGVPRGGIGVVGRTPQTASPDPWRNRVFDLPTGTGDAQAELWVQLANFEFRSGGIRRPWILGRPDAVQSWIGRGILREALLCGVGLFVGLAFLAQFALRPTENARGYFGLFALVIGLRAIPGSISDFGQLVAPWLSFDWIIRGEYLGTALVIFAGAGYFRIKVAGAMPPRTMRGFQLVALALAAIEIAAPLPTVMATFPFYLVLPPLVLAVVIVCYARAWWRGVSGVEVTLVGASVYLVVVAHDALRAALTQFGLGIELFPYFVVMWLLAEAGDLMRAFDRTFRRVESLSSELAEANFELQETEAAVVRFVPFDFLRLLGKGSIREVGVGDHAEARMSALYCEIRAPSDGAGPSTSQQAFRFLNDCVQRFEGPIHHRNGFVNQYWGHALLVLFPGGPTDAVGAALEIRSLAGAAGPGARERAPALGIGIATGALLLGTIGGDRHLTGGVIGAAVDEAQQLARLTSAYGADLLIDAATREGLDSASGLRIREMDRSAGGAETAPVFEVRAEGKP